VSHERVAPFSRKHRRYWFPVTGGMIVIGAINVGLGVCSYEAPKDSQPIDLGLTRDAGVDAANSMSASQLPREVMRAFAIRYPRTIPIGASHVDSTYVVAFPPGATHRTATFLIDGTFVRED
jgi:hypothetical protein